MSGTNGAVSLHPLMLLMSGVQILYCSRTHSQLSQFLSEIRSTEFGKLGGKAGLNVRCVALGSRRSLCVNKQVRRLRTVAGMNEKCRELREKKKNASKSEAGCAFYDKGPQHLFRDHVYAKVRDIEELADLGSASRYGMRRGV